MAGLFVLLHAFFLAAIQVLVYAGAVMVLFLLSSCCWISRRRNGAKSKFRRRDRNHLGGGHWLFFFGARCGSRRFPHSAGRAVEGDTAMLGQLLFTNYALPFEILSVLLLVAMVGVILLSKKDLK